MLLDNVLMLWASSARPRGLEFDDNLTRFDDFLASFYEIGGTFNDNLKSFPDELTIGRF